MNNEKCERLVMKKNRNSLKYKMEANPNKTYKSLKHKQKARISNLFYKEVFLFYREHNCFPEESRYTEIYKKIYDKMRSLAIWCPYEEFERNMVIKNIHIEECVIKDISDGKTEEIFAKKPKKTKAEIKDRRRKAKKKEKALQKDRTQIFTECDDTFAYIVGYTSGGAPYGTIWEDMGIDPELDYEDKVKSLLEENIDVE